MAPSPRVSPVREILEERLFELLQECEQVFDEQLSLRVAADGERARAALADQFNQAMRRLRQAPDAAQLGSTLVDAASAFASGAALFRISGYAARGERIRGVPADQAEAFGQLVIPLASAAALAEAVESRDPVTALSEAAQVSPQLTTITGQANNMRAFLYPVVTGDQVPACLYAWGTVQGSAVELLTQLAAAVWTALPAPGGLVNIRRTEGSGRLAWNSLPADEQRIHLRAQRFARVQAAEIRLFQVDAVQSGRAARDLYGVLGQHIDRARESFRKTFFDACPSMVDYLHLELLRTLANDDTAILGKDYPGPMV